MRNLDVKVWNVLIQASLVIKIKRFLEWQLATLISLYINSLMCFSNGYELRSTNDYNSILQNDPKLFIKTKATYGEST